MLKQIKLSFFYTLIIFSCFFCLWIKPLLLKRLKAAFTLYYMYIISAGDQSEQEALCLEIAFSEAQPSESQSQYWS